MLKIWIHTFILFLGVILSWTLSDEPLQALGIFLLLFSIISSFTLNKNKILLEPINFFSLFSLTIVLVEFYFYQYGFQRSKFIIATTFSQDIDFLFTKAIYLILLGYLCVCFSYFLCRRHINYEIQPITSINQRGLKYSIWILGILSVLNFIYIVYHFAGGNLMAYMQNVSVREYEYMSGGVTGIFLDFGIFALFYWIYYNYRYKQKFSYYFFIFLAYVMLMKYSQGRIFQTIGTLIAIYIVTYFIYFIHSKGIIIKQLLGIVVLGLVSLILYAYRLRSSLIFNSMAETDFLDQLTQFFQFEELSFYLIEKGNVPNIPVFMKIIDSWAADVGYLYGESILYPFYRFLPSAISPENISVSNIVKKEWYVNIEGGALPPTCFGEMFANGNILGLVLGMLLFGIFMAVVYNLLQRYRNIVYLVIYAMIVSSFFFIYPKGESDNLNLISIFIFLVTYVFILVFSSLFYRQPRK